MRGANGRIELLTRAENSDQVQSKAGGSGKNQSALRKAGHYLPLVGCRGMGSYT